jgi:hypothetical protein
MTQGTWTCLQFMLEHISTIIERYPITVGEYVYGQKVKCVEDHGNFDMVTVGTICGFEFFDSDTEYDVGFFYQIKVQSGIVIFRDGTVRDYVADAIERVRAEDVYPVDATLPVIKTELTV